MTEAQDYSVRLESLQFAERILSARQFENPQITKNAATTEEIIEEAKKLLKFICGH